MEFITNSAKTMQSILPWKRGFNFFRYSEISENKPINSGGQARKRVATPTDIEFIDPRKTARKIKGVSKKFLTLPLSVLFLVVALVFVMTRVVVMKGGVADFMERERTLEFKAHQLRLLEGENDQLRYEINRIKTDARYQKFLAREHLGVIASDEFLILFAKETGKRAK